MIELLTDNLWLAWIIVSLVCLITEIGSGDFYVICFSIGAIVSMVMALLGLPLWVQILVWAIASVLCIFFIRPKLLRKLHNKEEKPSNADALIGAEGMLIEAIKNGGHGYVKIYGDEWRCVTEDGSAMEVGEKVTVTKRDSIVLTVVRKM